MRTFPDQIGLYFTSAKVPWPGSEQSEALARLDGLYTDKAVKTYRGTIPANKYSTRESMHTLIKPLNTLENQVNQIHMDMMWRSEHVPLSLQGHTLARFLTCTL